MNVSKTALCAAAAALFAVVAPLAAQATTITTVGVAPPGPQSVVTGIDPLGGVYSIGGGDSTGELYAFNEITGLQADPTKSGVAFAPGAGSLARAGSFSITAVGDTFRSLDAGFGISFQTYTADGSPLTTWNATESADGSTLTFTAANGHDVLLPGELFNIEATFAQPIPAGFTYSFAWSDAVPEPATWGLMIAGLGMAGGVLRRKRTQAVAA